MQASLGLTNTLFSLLRQRFGCNLLHFLSFEVVKTTPQANKINILRPKRSLAIGEKA